MAKIESSIGSSGGGDSSQKVFTVDDHNSGVPHPQSVQFPQAQYGQQVEVTPEQLRAMKGQYAEVQKQESSKFLKETKNRVEIITGIGRKFKDVEIDGNKFTIRSLKGKERKRIAAVIENCKQVVNNNGQAVLAPTSAHDLRLEILKHALCKIDGLDIEIILGTENLSYEEQLNKREDLLMEMEDGLLEYLYNCYNDLSKEVSSFYNIKTPEDAKEAADAVRKSDPE